MLRKPVEACSEVNTVLHVLLYGALWRMADGVLTAVSWILGPRAACCPAARDMHPISVPCACARSPPWIAAGCRDTADGWRTLLLTCWKSEFSCQCCFHEQEPQPSSLTGRQVITS